MWACLKNFSCLLHLVLFVWVKGMAFPFNEKRNDPTPLKLEFSVERNIDLTVELNRDSKREVYAHKFDTFGGIFYTIDIDLGSNRQTSKVQIDTGSSDLWVSDTSYKASDSQTWRDLNEIFEISYANSPQRKGKMITDEFSMKNWKGAVLRDFQFAVVPNGNFVNVNGILGIGDRNTEANGRNYDNLPWAMVKSGITPKASYSMFLDRNKKRGTLIFGGIDTKKYAGKLERYPIDTRNGPGLKVNLGRISIDAEGQPSFPIGQPVLLDSGALFNYIPENIMKYLDKIFKTTIIKENGKDSRQVNCDQPTDKYINFDFGNNIIALSFYDSVNRRPNGECTLGFFETSDHITLGDIFLRNAYVYYDLKDQAISLGQASHSSESNVISCVDADSHTDVAHGNNSRPSHTEKWYHKIRRYFAELISFRRA